MNGLSKVIRALGGAENNAYAKLAKGINVKNSQVIKQWESRGKISAQHVLPICEYVNQLHDKTNLQPSELRPDLYPSEKFIFRANRKNV